MLHMKVKYKGALLASFEEGDMTHEVRFYKTHSVGVSEDEDKKEFRTLLCDCPEAKRFVMCRHWHKAAREAKFATIARGAAPVALQIFPYAEGNEPLWAQLYEDAPEGAFRLYVKPHERANTDPDLQGIGLVTQSDSMWNVRGLFLEWLSALPYLYEGGGCKSHYHKVGSGYHEHQDDHYDDDLGFDRQYLTDFYMLFVTGTCLVCHRADVPFDLDDAEGAW